MWKYQCKKHLIVLAVTFLIGVALSGVMGIQGVLEEVLQQAAELTNDETILTSSYIPYIVGGMVMAGTANGILLFYYVMQHFQIPALFLFLILFIGALDYAILIGEIVLIPSVIVCIYGWLTIPNRGKQKELKSSIVSNVQEIERIYRLHHTYVDEYEKMGHDAHKSVIRLNIMFAVGFAVMFVAAFVIQNMTILLLVMALYFILFFMMNRKKTEAFQPIVALLYNDCDPEACATAIFAYTNKMRFRKVFPLPQHLSQCMIYLNDPELAIDVLASCEKSKASFIYAYHSLMAYAYYQLGDRSMVAHHRDECIKAGGNRVRGALAVIKENTLRGIENRLDLMDHNFAHARENYEKGMNTLAFEFQRVDYHYYLGLIAFVERDIDAAKKHFEYVVRHGNKTYFTQKARDFLKTIESLQQTEENESDTL